MEEKINIEKLKELIKKLSDDVKKLNLWQEKIIEELDSIGNRKYAYYTSFSIEAKNKLKEEHPELFKE
jgi:hypothetical protein